MRVATKDGVITLSRHRGNPAMARFAARWPMPVVAYEGSGPLGAAFGVAFEVGDQEAQCWHYTLPAERPEDAEMVLDLVLDAIHETLCAVGRLRIDGLLLPSATIAESDDGVVLGVALFVVEVAKRRRARAGLGAADANAAPLRDAFLHRFATSRSGAQLEPFCARALVPRSAAGAIRLDLALVDGIPLCLALGGDDGMDEETVAALAHWAERGLRELAWAPAVPRALREDEAAALAGGNAAELDDRPAFEGVRRTGGAAEAGGGDGTADDAEVEAGVAAAAAGAGGDAAAAVEGAAVADDASAAAYPGLAVDAGDASDGAPVAASDAGADGAAAAVDADGVDADTPDAVDPGDAPDAAAGDDAEAAAADTLDTVDPVDAPDAVDPGDAADAAAGDDAEAAAAPEPPPVVVAPDPTAALRPLIRSPFARLVRVGADGVVAQMLAAAIDAVRAGEGAADVPAALGAVDADSYVVAGFAGVDLLVRGADGQTTAVAVRAFGGVDGYALAGARTRLRAGCARLVVVDLTARVELELEGWEVLALADLLPLFTAAVAAAPDHALFAAWVAYVEALIDAGERFVADVACDARSWRAPLRELELLAAFERRLLLGAAHVITAQLGVHGWPIRAPEAPGLRPTGARATLRQQAGGDAGRALVVVASEPAASRPSVDLVIVDPAAGFAYGVRLGHNQLAIIAEAFEPARHGQPPAGSLGRRNDFMHALAATVGVERAAIVGGPTDALRSLPLERHDLLDAPSRGALIGRCIETIWVLWERSEAGRFVAADATPQATL